MRTFQCVLQLMFSWNYYTKVALGSKEHTNKRLKIGGPSFINPCPADTGYTLPLQTVYIQISWLWKKPTDLDLHCLSLSIWICIDKLDQVIWLAASLGGSVGCASDWWSGGCEFEPRPVGNILSLRFDHEIFSTVIPFLPLIQEGQLSVSGKRICTILVNCIED